jgi:hypothetical protein
LQFPAKKIMKEIRNSQKRDFPGGKRRSGETGKSTFHHMMRGGVGYESYMKSEIYNI